MRVSARVAEERSGALACLRHRARESSQVRADVLGKRVGIISRVGLAAHSVPCMAVQHAVGHGAVTWATLRMLCSWACSTGY